MELQRQIKIARIKKGYNQKELSDNMGVSVTTVSNWETGLSSPNIDKLKELSEFLECEFVIK